MSSSDEAVPPYDLVGVGIGPFNLALAALAHPTRLRTCFFEAREEFSWHPGLLLDGARLQVPFLADLVSLVDPTSRWSFLSYLAEHDRLFPFYFSERFHVPRREYDHYCRWVSGSLPSCAFGVRIESVSWQDGLFRICGRDAAGGPVAVRARNVVLGVGTEPVIPAPLAPLIGADVFHTGEYLGRLPALTGASDVTVVGSGQSGAEVFLDLLRRQPGTRMRWITRSAAFAPMEYSKLGLEHFTPDYTRYFRGLPTGTRDRLVPAQWQLYKAASAETLAEIHDVLYERTVGGRAANAELMPCVAVETAQRASGRGIVLDCRHTEQDAPLSITTDRVVLATGYAARRPRLLGPLDQVISWDERGRYRVDADFRVALAPEVTGSLFVQNGELHTHGVGAPDLGLGAWRAATIVNAIAGTGVYRLPKTTAFTTFGVAPGGEMRSA